MSSLCFVHAADLHLDSPFVGLKSATPSHVARRLLNATFDALIDLCLKERVSALLVAGDVYDGAERSLRAQLRFVDGLKRLDAAGIRSFVYHGNHDPLDGWQARLDFPKTAHQFGPKVQSLPLDPADPDLATVTGVSYATMEVLENLVPGFAAAERCGFSIGLLHCNAGGDPEHQPYAACSVSDLISSGFDYWALGHIHRHQVLNPSHPLIIYPGNTQGRHLKEPGPRGAYLVEVEESGQAHYEFHETSVVRWETLELSISGAESLNALIDRASLLAADALAAAAGRDLLFGLRVQGHGPLHAECRKPGFADELQARVNADSQQNGSFAWCERVELATAGELDQVAGREGADYLGELLRLFDLLEADPGQTREVAAALDQLYENPKLGRFLRDARPGDDELKSVLGEAKAAALEALA